MSKPDDIAYEYVGKDGEHLASVPMADITFGMLESEITPLGLRDLAHSPLYKAVGPRVAKLQQEPSEEPVEPDAKPAKGSKE